jgi:hypothetical protein
MTVTTRRLRTVEGPSHRQHRPTVDDLERFARQGGLDDMEEAVARVRIDGPCPACGDVWPYLMEVDRGFVGVDCPKCGRTEGMG